ncbi:MAG TPA: hypothetical protein VMZ53_30210 [Kofleriaceae bacterium]|nr:hypothetical protein [Kofleriaceae bacterium]
MRALLACAAMLVATRAYADEPQPTPTGPTLPTSPAPAPAPGPGAETAPSQPATPEPKADPAYGEKPDPAYGPPPGSTVPESSGPSAGRDIYIKSYPDRSHKNVMGLSIAGGAAVVLGGVGLYFHLDSRSKSNDVSANKYTGEVWTAERQDTYDSANRSAVVAGVFYGIGGAVLIGTAIAYMITEPKMETTVLHPHTSPKPTAMVAPTRGGALVGGAWSF